MKNVAIHSGVNTTLNLIRTKFWIIRDRQIVKKLLKKCIICKIVQGKTLKPPDCPSLPKFRLECNHAFENVGLDYAGPLFIKNPNYNKEKCYILLFTCAVTRAIHLELCTDLSADVLILAIKRFSSRRGVPKLFVSDNFKSFKSILLKNYLLKEGMNWQFILEKSPWWGGFYERLVGIVKTLLKKIIGKALCNYEKLTTSLCEVESAVNMRPLTYVNDELSNILTPYHMIYGRNIDSYCDNHLNEITSDDVRKTFKHQQKTLELFKKRFEEEYIIALREKHIYNRPNYSKNNNVIIDDVVLIK